MALSAKQINKLLFFKLPSAFICGVRTKSLNAERCETSVRYRWINQNPFNSMYFAVQAMAAELSTGALVMYHIQKSGASVSMLVGSNNATFSKKATGRIKFRCEGGEQVASAITKTIESGEGVLCKLLSIGTNENGEEVSRMEFEWTFKLRKPR